MTIFKKRAPTHEQLLARMDAVGRELGFTNEVLEQILRRRKRQRTIAGFPFNLLEWVIRRGLALLERAVTRLVYAIGRK